MNGSYCVYKHITPSQKVYIGITSMNPLKRWRNGNGYRNNFHFWNAIIKYGWDNITHEIICEGLNKEEACQKEIELIALYKSNQKEFGYNHSSGGDINQGFTYSHSESFKRHMSQVMTGNHNWGPQNGCNNGFYGRHHSKEAKKKISDAQYKPVLQYDKQGNFIAEYANSYQAQLQTGILHIHEVCKGLRKSVGGYIWRYK